MTQIDVANALEDFFAEINQINKVGNGSSGHVDSTTEIVSSSSNLEVPVGKITGSDGECSASDSSTGHKKRKLDSSSKEVKVSKKKEKKKKKHRKHKRASNSASPPLDDPEFIGPHLPSNFDIVKKKLLDLDKFSRFKNEMQTISNKLRYLGFVETNLDVLTTIFIELQARFADLEAGGLSVSLFDQRLTEANLRLSKFESDSLPTGWISLWDESNSAYYYQNLGTGMTQWEFPGEEGKVNIPVKEDTAAAPQLVSYGDLDSSSSGSSSDSEDQSLIATIKKITAETSSHQTEVVEDNMELDSDSDGGTRLTASAAAAAEACFRAALAKLSPGGFTLTPGSSAPRLPQAPPPSAPPFLLRPPLQLPPKPPQMPNFQLHADSPKASDGEDGTVLSSSRWVDVEPSGGSKKKKSKTSGVFQKKDMNQLMNKWQNMQSSASTTDEYN